MLETMAQTSVSGHAARTWGGASRGPGQRGAVVSLLLPCGPLLLRVCTVHSGVHSWKPGEKVPSRPILGTELLSLSRPARERSGRLAGTSEEAPLQTGTVPHQGQGPGQLAWDSQSGDRGLGQPAHLIPQEKKGWQRKENCAQPPTAPTPLPGSPSLPPTATATCAGWPRGGSQLAMPQPPPQLSSTTHRHTGLCYTLYEASWGAGPPSRRCDLQSACCDPSQGRSRPAAVRT